MTNIDYKEKKTLAIFERKKITKKLNKSKFNQLYHRQMVNLLRVNALSESSAIPFSKIFYLTNKQKEKIKMNLSGVSRYCCYSWLSVLIIMLLIIHPLQSLTIEKSAYKNIVIEIKDNVPLEECSSILADLEVSYMIQVIN